MEFENFLTRYETGAKFDLLKRIGLKRLFEIVCEETGLDYYQIGLLLERPIIYGKVKIELYEFSPGFGYSLLKVGQRMTVLTIFLTQLYFLSLPMDSKWESSIFQR
jgi:hypothetical protein